MPSRPEPLPPGNPRQTQLLDHLGRDTWYAFIPSEGPGLPVYLRLAWQSAGRLACTGLMMGDFGPPEGPDPRPITAAALRDVRLPELIGEVLTAYTTSAKGGRDDEERWRQAAIDFTVVDLPALGPRPGRAGYTSEHYEKVAQLYRRALQEAPQRPTAWLCEQSNQSAPTMRRWLAHARREGYLGEASPGVAGETPLTETEETQS